MIVSSILLAFAIDAWWDNRQVDVAEAAYLNQLSLDLRTSVANLERASTWQADQTAALGATLAAYRTGDPLGVDSVGLFVRERHLLQFNREVRVVRGTLDALIQTGDVRLIQDTGLRLALIEYQSQLDATLPVIERYVDDVKTNTMEVVVEWDAAVDLDPTGRELTDAQLSWLSEERSREMRASLLRAAVAAGNLDGHIARLLEATSEMEVLLSARGSGGHVAAADAP